MRKTSNLQPLSMALRPRIIARLLCFKSWCCLRNATSGLITTVICCICMHISNVIKSYRVSMLSISLFYFINVTNNINYSFIPRDCFQQYKTAAKWKQTQNQHLNMSRPPIQANSSQQQNHTAINILNPKALAAKRPPDLWRWNDKIPLSVTKSLVLGSMYIYYDVLILHRKLLRCGIIIREPEISFILMVVILPLKIILLSRSE